MMVAGDGFEPSKAEPGDLQSPPIGRSGNPPRFSIKQHAQITLDSSLLEIELMLGLIREVLAVSRA